MEIRHRSAIHTAAQSNIALFHSEPNIQLYFIYIQEIKLAQTKSHKLHLQAKFPSFFCKLSLENFCRTNIQILFPTKAQGNILFYFYLHFDPIIFLLEQNRTKRNRAAAMGCRSVIDFGNID
ncbi:hypothetical protein BARVI_09900 [Barnesiella viscericola DSM 18177]|uniref:Uncharacterized protein n=1 Tax=Barnesiella viscericola DSM 18177 TaxID=880074 RepID=W0EWH9_9BACT|nr:hypothetical protein BARVI_09900 [Barnesiella viscericola DSM 18177]